MSVSSDVTIANLALLAIGTRNNIVSFTEGSVEANVVSLIYPVVREELLREAHWGFARKQVNLALLNDSTQLLPSVTAFSMFAGGATSIVVSNGVGVIPGATVSGLGIVGNTTVISAAGFNVTLSEPTTGPQTAAALTFTPNQYQPVPQPWTYEYIYPQDCLQMREILPLIPTQQINEQLFGLPNNGTVNNFGGLNRSPVIKYLISTDTINGQTQTVILTNQPAAIGVYTYSVTNPSFMPPDFVYAFAGRLAGRLCIGLSGDKALTAIAVKEADTIIQRAKARDGNEGIETVNRTPDWIAARGFVWNYGYGSEGPWGSDCVTTGYYF